jgi:hypothetical protein
MSIYKSSLIAKVRLDLAKVRLVQASMGGRGGAKGLIHILGFRMILVISLLFLYCLFLCIIINLKLIMENLRK